MAEAEGASGSEESTPSPISSLESVFGSTERPALEASGDEDGDKDEAKDEGDQKFPLESSSDEKPAKADEKSDEKEDKSEKPSLDVKKDAKADLDVKSDSKEEKPSDEKVKPDKWDVEDNPFKKRWKDTAATQNREHQENLQLKAAVQQMQQETHILKKIADGTYDPEKDDPSKQITPERVASSALQVGKALASRSSAVGQFGEEKVNADLDEFHQVFGNHSLIQQMVLDSEAPVHEAFRILDRYRFEKQYGSTPDAWKKSIRAEVEAELRPLLTKEITDKIMGRADKAKSTPRGLNSSRGSNGLDSSSNSKGSKGSKSLKDLFSQ